MNFAEKIGYLVGAVLGTVFRILVLTGLIYFGIDFTLIPESRFAGAFMLVMALLIMTEKRD